MYQADLAETKYVEGPTARFAYSTVGPKSDVPLVLLHRLRGTLGYWDPALLDALAEDRQVVIFDNVGVGATEGSVPESIADMAKGAVEFIEALGLKKVDLLGWSMGGMVAQEIVLEHPELVRRLVVAGSTPGGVPGSPEGTEEQGARIGEIVGTVEPSDDDYLWLFFAHSDTSREAGLKSVRRIDERRKAREKAEFAMSEVGAQAGAIGQFASGVNSAWDRLESLTTPVLYANGAHDIMHPAFDSFSAAAKIPHSRVRIYGDAGHAFLFQFPEEFAKDVNDFLR
jgi:pimeloyl-ACP methyl ester carboxylesterase